MGSFTNLLQQNGVSNPNNQISFLVLKPLIDAIKQLDGLSNGLFGSITLS